MVTLPEPSTRVLAFKVPRPRWPGKARSLGIFARRATQPGRVARLDAGAASGFARLTVVPAIALIAWLIPGLPLLLAGDFVPVPMLLIAAPLAAALAVNTLHRVPDHWPTGMDGDGQAASRGAAWASLVGLIGTAAVATGFMLGQLVLGSPSLFAVRGPGAAFQAGYWIAQHGSLPIPGSLAAFGGPGAAVHLSSAGFYSSGGSVVPGVLAGLPMLLAAGFWTSGLTGGAVVAPVLGGLAVLSFGGLVGRLVGRFWAPAGALALAVTLPELYTSRDVFSEPAVQVLLFGGLSLVIDAMSLRPVHGPASGAAAGSATTPSTAAGFRRLPSLLARAITSDRLLAGLGGLALGLTSLFSLASLPYLILAVAAAGVVLSARRAAGVAFCLGLGTGAGYGIIAGYVLARPLMVARQPTLAVIGLDTAIAVVAVGVAFALARARPLQRVRDLGRKAARRRPVRWLLARLTALLPAIAAGVVVVAVAAMLARPYLQTAHGTLGTAATRYVAELQRAAGLRVAPTRLYSEYTLYWVVWYAGLPAVLLAGFGAAVLVRRSVRASLRREDPSGTALNWALPLAVLLGGAAVVLWQPFTVPDQPWASRRLVPVVLPAVILLATWAAAWLVRFARAREAGAATTAVVGTLCVVAMLVPALWTSFGVGLTHTGVGGGLRTSAGGLAQHRVGTGQTQAVQQLCGALGRSAAVLIVDPRLAADLTPAIRGICGIPVASASPADVPGVIGGIERAGRRPVLLGATAAQVRRFGGSAVLVLRLVTTQYPHVLTQAPGAPRPAKYEVWMSALGTAGTGA